MHQSGECSTLLKDNNPETFVLETPSLKGKHWIHSCSEKNKEVSRPCCGGKPGRGGDERSGRGST